MVRDKLKKARATSGYTQDEMAAILGVDRSTYSYYETGRTDIPVKVLMAAASVFDIAFEWFITPDMKPLKPIEQFNPVLNSVNIFLPETLPKDAGDSEGESGAAHFASEERIIIARYRILKEAGRDKEIDKYMSDLVAEEMDKM